jgi:Cu/Ag efflux protein CusF
MLLLAAAGAAQAHAQAGAAPAIPAHDSALAGYRQYKDEKLANWRDVNDLAGVLGGHNAHLRAVAHEVEIVGTVLEIDRAAGRLRFDGEAVKPLGWPAGIAFWGVKDAALAASFKPGERLVLRLQLDGEAYRAVGFSRNAPRPAALGAPSGAAPAAPHAGHGGAR